MKIDIPKRIKVGFQSRNDTYTGKLGFAIPSDDTKSSKDGSTVFRQERSWNSWCKSDLGEIVFDNVPTEGLILNRRVGGYRSEFGHRNTYIRVWHPQDFEFEIPVDNLLYIMEYHSACAGKMLEGSYVLAWENSKPYLMPVASDTYREVAAGAVLDGKVKTISKPGTFFKFPKETDVYEYICKAPELVGTTSTKYWYRVESAYGGTLQERFAPYKSREQDHILWNHTKGILVKDVRASVKGHIMSGDGYISQVDIVEPDVRVKSTTFFTQDAEVQEDDLWKINCKVHRRLPDSDYSGKDWLITCAEYPFKPGSDKKTSFGITPIPVVPFTTAEWVLQKDPNVKKVNAGQYRSVDNGPKVNLRLLVNREEGLAKLRFTDATSVYNNRGYFYGGRFEFTTLDYEYVVRYDGELDIAAGVDYSVEEIYAKQKPLVDKLKAAGFYKNVNPLFYWSSMTNAVGQDTRLDTVRDSAGRYYRLTLEERTQ